MTSSAGPRRGLRAAVPAAAAVSLLAAGLTTAMSAQAAQLPQAPGTVYVADPNDHKVVAVPPDGGTPTTVVDNVSAQALARTPAGDLFVADAGSGSGDGRILKVPADGSASTVVASGLDLPTGVAVNGAGDVFVADRGTAQVLEFPAAGGAPTSLGTGLVDPTGVAVNGIGDVFIADFGADKVYELPGEGGAQHPVGVGLSKPYGVAIENDEFIMVSDSGHNRVVEIEPEDDDTFDTGLAVTQPKGVYVDDAGDVYVAQPGKIVELRLGGAQVEVHAGLTSPYGVAAVTPNFPAGSPPPNASKGTAYSFYYKAYDATGATPSYALHSGTLPPGLTLEAATGWLSGTPTTPGSYTSVVENTTNHTLTPSTTINVSGPGTLFFGLHKQHGKGANRVMVRVRADDPLRRATAESYVPDGMALDASGGLFIAEHAVDRVTEVPAFGLPPFPIGTRINNPNDVAVDANDNVYIADTRHNRVVQVPARGGTQTTVAGNIKRPISVAVDKAGNVYVLRARGSVVKIPASGGGQTTIAKGFTDDPVAIAADAKGNVYVADPNNNRVVKVPANGKRQRKVGSGLSRPSGVSVDTAGNVYIADTGNQRVVELPAGGGDQRVVARKLFGVVDVEAIAG